MLARDGVKVDATVTIEVELQQREAPELRLHNLLSELTEPWLLQQVVNLFVCLLIADELYRSAAGSYESLSVDTDEVWVGHERRRVHVVETCTVVHVDSSRRLQ